MKQRNKGPHPPLLTRPAVRTGPSLHELTEMARNHPSVAVSSLRRKQVICDQEKPGTCQVPQRWKGQEATMEGGPEKQIKGQLCPNGSGCHPNHQMPPHQTPRETEKGRMMLPLRSPRTHVQGMPQKDQQTPSVLKSADGNDPTNCYHIQCRGGDHPNRNR